ncbi:dynein axonemal assembly factor 4 isoform X2 [Procambarus clarkii]|uniref:dynein axonemal assembly factor 4 isoform X2 n=1 Tax=Procambarus clarkii TaxID=6728 RepID=UPI0037441ED1
MPIHVSDYTWQQTHDKIILSLDLHHTSPKNVDIVTTNSYLKVSFLPYIFEAFLCHMINADQSTARIAKGRVEFDLAKENKVHWSNFCLKLNREEMQIKRQEAIKDVEEKQKKKEELRKEERTLRERFAVAQQISEDDKTREERNKLIEKEKIEFFSQSIKNNPQKDEAQDTAKPDLRHRVSSTCSEDGACIVQEVDYDGDGEDSLYYSSTENLHLKIGKVKIDNTENVNRKQRKSSSIRKAEFKDKEGKKKDDRKKVPVMPPVRQNCTIKVKYTPRVFPSPSRESTQAEEQQWLMSQSRNSSSAEDGNSERNEEYYKNKAVSLFGNGDYSGCVNACTEALKINPTMPSLYSNRAAGNLALDNLHHTVNDCTKALELLTPITEDNGKSRLLCHIRRGTAFVRLGLLSEGLADYQAAKQISPENKSLQKDVERIQSMVATCADMGDSDGDSGCDDGVKA